MSLWLAIASVLGVSVVLAVVNPDAAFIADEWFIGTDTYMRVVRVREWLAGGAWYDTLSHRSNWPYGETLHWTRPLDLFLVVLAAPLWPVLGAHKALYVAALTVGPVALLAAIGVLLWGTCAILDSRGRVIMVILLALQPFVQSIFMVARPDHHSLNMLSYAAVLACLVRYSSDPGRNGNAAVMAGAAAAFGMWVSVEALAIELFALLALGLPWLLTGQETWLNALRRFTFTGAVALAVVLTVERPPAEWLTSEEYDRVSTVHVMLLALIALGVEAMHRAHARVTSHVGAGPWRRIGMAGLSAAGVAAMMAVLFPAFFKGPFGAAMDARLKEMWLDNVSEYQPLWQLGNDAVSMPLIVLGPVLWTVVWGRHALRNRTFGAHTTSLVLTLGLAAFFFAPLACYQARWAGYVGIATIIPWALLLSTVMDWRGGPVVGSPPGTPVLRVPLLVLVAVSHLLAALWAENPTLEGASFEENTSCRWRELAPILNSKGFSGGEPRVLLTFSHMGPELLYRTPHRVVGTPYHRNTRGLIDTFTVFTSEDVDVIKKILFERDVDYVITCVNAREETLLLTAEGETLARRLHEDRPPTWLEPVDLPAAVNDDFNVYAFAPNLTPDPVYNGYGD